MEPVLPDAPVEESEFDLDVRLEAVARHAADSVLASEGKDCPDAPSNYDSCAVTCACTAFARAGGCG
jgi:hypothetical protein